MLNLAIPCYKLTESESPEPANPFVILRALRGDRFFWLSSHRYRCDRRGAGQPELSERE